MHRNRPLADQRGPDHRATAQKRQPPAAEIVTRHSSDRRQPCPRHWTDVWPATFAVKDIARRIQQPLEPIGEGACERQKPEVVFDEVEDDIQCQRKVRDRCFWQAVYPVGQPADILRNGQDNSPDQQTDSRLPARH